MKRAEDSLRDFWDHIKCTNIRIIGVPEEEEEKKGYEKIFEEIIVENFPNMEKEIENQVQEAQRVSYRINQRRNMPRHIIIKLTKTKHKERTKSSKGEATSNIQGKLSMLTADLVVCFLCGLHTCVSLRVLPHLGTHRVKFNGDLLFLRDYLVLCSCFC